LEKIQIKFESFQKGMLEMANGMAKNVREESKLLQEMVTVEKRNENKRQKAKGTTILPLGQKQKRSLPVAKGA
jgi:hypothetical protein